MIYWKLTQQSVCFYTFLYYCRSCIHSTISTKIYVSKSWHGITTRKKGSAVAMAIAARAHQYAADRLVTGNGAESNASKSFVIVECSPVPNSDVHNINGTEDIPCSDNNADIYSTAAYVPTDISQVNERSEDASTEATH
eukprot:2712612-Ditylum_brightwellii.AAC.1